MVLADESEGGGPLPLPRVKRGLSGGSDHSTDDGGEHSPGRSGRFSLKKLLSMGSDGSFRVRRARSVRTSMRRSNTFALGNMSAAEMTHLMENTVYKKTFQQNVKPYMPLILWILWILTGTVFYAVHDEFGWAKGFLMSVNVGWSIAWTVPGDPLPSPYNSILSKLVSVVHNSIGSIFLGVAVLFMARDLMENKDSWIVMSMKRDELENKQGDDKTDWGDVVALLKYYISKLRVAKWSIVWIVFGCLWYSFSDDFDNFFGVIDFIASTLCAGGYKSLSSNSNSVQYIVTGLYAAIGIPLFKISLGLLLSLIMKKPEDKLMYEKMVAPVTLQEQEFMEAFGIDDGDGSLDYKEFVILMAVRMGSVPPHLVKEIQDKFHMLDRKQCGEIPYSDLILPATAMSRKERIRQFIGSSSFNGSMGSISSDNENKTPEKSRSDLLPIGVSPSSSSKVLPFHDQLSNNNIVVVPGDVKRPSSKIKPISNNASKETEMKLLSDLSSSSIEPLENSEDSSEKNMKKCKDIETNENDENMSIQSFESCNDQTNKTNPTTENEQDISHGGFVESKLKITSLSSNNDDNLTAQSTTPTAQSCKNDCDEDDFFEDKNDTISDITKQSECRNAVGSVPPLPTGSPKKKQKKTFRATMSMGSNTSGSDDNMLAGHNKLTPRQKEFLDEQEKLRNAQKNIEMKNNMGRLGYFLHHQLLPHLGAIVAWALWLIGGAVFYTIHEGVSISKGLYMSTSIGYGIFWIELKGDPTSNIYTTFHFLIGIGVIAGAMSLLAQYLLSQDKNWYNDAMKAKELEIALKTDGFLDDVIAVAQYYWPHFKVHCFLFIFVALGALFGAFAFSHWGTLDCLYFAVSTMTSGGFIHIPADAPDWCYLVVCFYVAFGVPIMSISCGILAHQIASKGSAALKVEKVNAQVTPEEIEKMEYYGIEDGSGAVDSQEYVILILVRIGAISPEIISVLQDRFDSLDSEKSGKILYENLRGEETSPV